MFQKSLILALFLAMCQIQALGQKASEEIEVFTAVSSLFDGIRAGDSAVVRMVFYPDARMFTVTSGENGDQVFVEGSAERFLAAIGTPRDEVWDERIWNTDIQVDGDLAQVWMNYAFYIDDTLSHCGVNAMHLINTPGEGWQIFHITDTRHDSGCQIPEDIRD